MSVGRLGRIADFAQDEWSPRTGGVWALKSTHTVVYGAQTGDVGALTAARTGCVRRG